MDIIVQREALLKPLQAINGVVEKKQTLPILANVLLAVNEQRLQLTGTDLEIELIGFVPIETLTTEGKATVSARKLFDICRTLPEGSLLNLSLDKNNLLVRAGESYFMLNTLPYADFPNLDEATYATEFEVPQNQFKDLLAKTYFAMGQQDVRHYLNGSLLDIGQNTIKCVAADGHRLALASIHLESLQDMQARVILPRKSVLELMRLLTDEETPATIFIGEGRFRVKTAEFIFTTKLINAQYPDYNRLIPKGAQSAIGERDLIKQALTRASILSNEKFRGVRFQLETQRLRITANNADQEQAEEAVGLEYAGDAMEIGFNVAYLLDVVSAIGSKMIRCVFTDSNSGVLIAPHVEDADTQHAVYVVMPMRL